MKIDEIRKLIEQDQNEINHLNDIRMQLEASRGSLTAEEYERELKEITDSLETIQKNLNENQNINLAYNNMLTNIRALNSLNNVIARDRQDETAIAEEKEVREEEIKNAMQNLPEELQGEIRDIILQENRVEEVNVEPRNEIETPVPVADTKSLKESLNQEISQSRNELNHLNDVIEQLEASRNNLTPEEYSNELKTISEAIKNEQEKLTRNTETNRAYDNMLTNLTALNELNKIEARDEQDRKEMEEERTARITEIAKSRESLSEEMQQEIRDLALNNRKEKMLPTTINLLDKDFNPHGISFDDFRRQYREAVNKNQNNHEVFKQLNNIYNDLRTKQRLEQKNDHFLKDENGKIVYYPNTSIPEPRQQRVDESIEEYNEFLKNIYDNDLKQGNYYKSKEEIKQLTTGKEDYKKLPVHEEFPKLPKHEEYPKLPKYEEPTIEIKTKPKKETETKQKKSIKTLQQIMYELQHGLKIKTKTGKRYQASNIKVAKQFKEELHSGNWLYNVVHLAPTVLKSAVAEVRKMYSKWQLWRTKQTPEIEELKTRINKLSKEDLEVIWNEYRGTQVNQDSFTTALNQLLNERIQKYAKKEVQEINTKISSGYNKIFADYQVIEAIDKELVKTTIKEEDKKKLQLQKASLLKGKAEQIGNLRELYIKGNQYYSGGAHGFSEDMKAAGTNLSKVGKRFAKAYDYDDELQEQKARLEMLEKSAVNRKDDIAAIKAFVQYETLKNKETEIKNSIFGKRSTGKMYYSPLVGELDYRDDPFIRDVFTTVAMVGAAVSAANALHTHETEAKNIIENEQAKANEINNNMSQVRQTGQDIANNRETFEKGMQAQANSDSINILNVGERGASDASVNAGFRWSSGTVYKQADEVAHATAKQAYETAQSQIEDIAAKYTQGLLSKGEVTQAYAEMASQSQQTLNSVIQNAMPHFQTYMQSHPQFELSEVGNAMNYLIQNPNAISDMYQGMVNVTNLGENIAGLTATQVEALQSLPSDLQTTLLGAVSSAALAYNCAKSTGRTRTSAKSEQEEQVIDLVNNYANAKEMQAEATPKTK